MAPRSGWGLLSSLKGSTTHDASVQQRVAHRELAPSAALALASTDRETATTGRGTMARASPCGDSRSFASAETAPSCTVAQELALSGCEWTDASSHVHDE
ncbi:hypothetical protein DPSP01_007098 [Paraphaeosphaeria sporulosa]